MTGQTACHDRGGVLADDCAALPEAFFAGTAEAVAAGHLAELDA